MTRGRFPGLLIAILQAVAACSGGSGVKDARPETWADVPVAVLDLAQADPGPRDPGTGDSGFLDEPDPGPPADAVESFPDPGPDPGPEPVPDVPLADVPDVAPPPPFCTSFQDCADGEVCDFPLGRCQGRSTWTDATLGVYGFHPASGSPGDTLVLDGRRFTDSPMGMPKVKIGAVVVGGLSLEFSENRILVPVTQAMSGPITVWDPQNHYATMTGTFSQAPAGVIGCDGSTPWATYLPGTTLGAIGSYAAGYVDLGDALRTRVFYPADCGSIRRPPVPGTWPFVLILHGNGAPHLNYEYLAQLLATWGFVSAMPATQMNMAGEDFSKMLEELMPVVTKLRGRALGDVHPVLAGVTTTADIAFIGHSRGTGRAEEVIGADPDIAAHTKGAVFLGPVDDGKTVPGLFLLFGGLKDAQSLPWQYNAIYAEQPGPKWYVEFKGGNHGSFCDHKVYGYGGLLGAFGDQKPLITRERQLFVVQTFVVPLMQRAFGLPEPFAGQLDDPPAVPECNVKHEG
jgi:hypothetical protein